MMLMFCYVCGHVHTHTRTHDDEHTCTHVHVSRSYGNYSTRVCCIQPLPYDALHGSKRPIPHPSRSNKTISMPDPARTRLSNSSRACTKPDLFLPSIRAGTRTRSVLRQVRNGHEYECPQLPASAGLPVDSSVLYTHMIAVVASCL